MSTLDKMREAVMIVNVTKRGIFSEYTESPAINDASLKALRDMVLDDVADKAKSAKKAGSSKSKNSPEREFIYRDEMLDAIQSLKEQSK